MTDEVVTRLYRALVEELRRRGHPEGRPVKVSDLYRELVPYRAVRSTLDVELNADYEHALLRLLSGERDLLRLEPAEAREELRREVEAPYPFVGLFRKFSASNVWVNMPAEQPIPAPEATPAEPAPRPVSADARDGQPARTRDGTGPADAPAPGQEPGTKPQPVARGAAGQESAAVERVPVQLHAEQPSHDPAERMTHAGQACAFCNDPLPSGRRVRFCPHCGGDQRLRPCPRCDAVLERGWQYCISCGNEVAGR
ncbi:MAG: hypothetical protein R6U63_10315 [Longimicrobiales bacterium]